MVKKPIFRLSGNRFKVDEKLFGIVFVLKSQVFDLFFAWNVHKKIWDSKQILFLGSRSSPIKKTIQGSRTPPVGCR